MNASEAYKLALSSDTASLKPIIDQIRAAAKKGHLSTRLEAPPSDVQRRLLIGAGYGFDPDGSIQWSGCSCLNETHESMHGDYEIPEERLR